MIRYVEAYNVPEKRAYRDCSGRTRRVTRAHRVGIQQDARAQDQKNRYVVTKTPSAMMITTCSGTPSGDVTCSSA